VIAYFDASAMVKLVVDEEDTPRAQDLWDAAGLRLTSILTYAECRAAIGAAARAHRLRGDTSGQARGKLDVHWGEIGDVGVDAALIRHAGDLAETHALRGYDAVHLASATQAGLEGGIVVVTWDMDLARAARDVGLAVAPAGA
jgi:predicted nucleic acid-binding protein